MSQDIENQVATDLKTVLTNAGISNVVTELETQPQQATFTLTRCINVRESLEAGNIPSGMRTLDVAIEAFSKQYDDTDGSALSILVSSIRTAIYDENILTTLNNASTNYLYYGLQTGTDIFDTQENYRIISIQFSLITKTSK